MNTADKTQHSGTIFHLLLNPLSLPNPTKSPGQSIHYLTPTWQETQCQ